MKAFPRPIRLPDPLHPPQDYYPKEQAAEGYSF